MKKKKGISKLFSLLICFVYGFVIFPSVGALSDESLTALAEAIEAEQLTDHEPANAVTRDLSLTVPNLPENVTAEFESSNPSVLYIDGGIGRVIRETYIPQDVTLIVRLRRNSETATKELHITVLSQSTTVYMSDSFYYPGYENFLITNVTPITDAMGINTGTSSLYGGGWSTLYQTSLDETTTNGRRFKTLLGMEDNEYCLYSYRREAFDEFNYTRYIFKNKPLGKSEISMRLKFAESAENPRQIYLFQLYANYLLSNGSLERAKPIEIQFHRSATGHWITLNGQGFINSAIPETGVWCDCSFKIDLDEQIYDFYIGDTKINTEPVDFYSKGEINRENCRAINDFQFNSYRQYGGDAFYLDDMVAKSDNSYYEANQYKLRLADMMDFSSIAFYNGGSAVSANSVTGSFTLSMANNISDYINEHNLSISWESSDPSVLSVSGNAIEVNRGILTKNVTLTAKIQEAGGGEYVQKDYRLTVPFAVGMEAINTAYQSLRPEVMTTQAPLEITDNLVLPVFDGVTINWISSDTSLITNDGLVFRPKADQRVTMTAEISDTNGNVIAKELQFGVLAEKKYVYGAENFYHPPDLNLELSNVTELQRWRNIYTASEPRLTNTIVREDDGNYIMQTQRTEVNETDYNFCSYRFPKALENNGTVSFRFKLGETSGSQIYMLQLFGTKKQDGSVDNEAQIAEIQLYYTGTGGRVLAMSPKEQTRTIVLTNDPPKTDRWYTARFVLDNTAQTYDFYLDGERMNEHPIRYYAADEDADFTAVSIFRYNSYRYYSGGIICVDDVSVVGEGGAQIECVLYDDGTEKTNNPGQVISGNMDAKVYMYNCTDAAIDGGVFLAVYQNDKLLYAKTEEVSLGARDSGRTVLFSDLQLPYEDDVVVKAFLFSGEDIKPVAKCVTLYNKLNDVHAKAVIDSGTGRTYYMINLLGKQSIKGYFTQQGFSADNTKFYFWNEDLDIYEFDIAADRGRFIDRGIYDFNICTSPLNNLFYLNKNREIIKMNCSTYEKTTVTKIPEAYSTGKASMLQVTNDESRLSIEWADAGGSEEYGPIIDPQTQKRFPVYDMVEERWIADSVHNGFDTEEYPLPNHLNINPSPSRNNLVLFAHEGNYIHDRVWVMDTDTGESYNAFYQHPYTDTDDGEGACHETWSYDGERILFCKSGRIGYGGLVTVRYDGTDRRYINNDYGYLHAGISPVTDRWIVSDTSYNGINSNIVLVDAYTGDSYLIATVHQTGENPGHCHPGFSQDGNMVYFGLYDEDNVVSIGWADVSDIIAAAPDVMTYSLSENCQIETAERLGEVRRENVGGETAYVIPEGSVMRVQAQVEETERLNANIVVRYYDQNTDGICLDYYVWEKNDGIYSLTPKTYELQGRNSGTWKTAVIHLSDINMENMELRGGDFILRGNGGSAVIGSVYVSTIDMEGALELLSAERISNEPLSMVTQNLTLPVSVGDEDFEITWESSDESVVANDGSVTRHTSEWKSAVITATVTNGSETETVSHNITVVPMTVNVYLHETFYYPDAENTDTLYNTPYISTWWRANKSGFSYLDTDGEGNYYTIADYYANAGFLTAYLSGERHDVVYLYMNVKTDGTFKNGIHLRPTIRNSTGVIVMNNATIGKIHGNYVYCGQSFGSMAGILNGSDFTPVVIKLDLPNNQISAKVGEGDWSTPVAMRTDYTYTTGDFIAELSFVRGSSTYPENRLLISEAAVYTE